jgi:hypothetical protein
MNFVLLLILLKPHLEAWKGAQRRLKDVHESVIWHKDSMVTDNILYYFACVAT